MSMTISGGRSRPAGAAWDRSREAIMRYYLIRNRDST